MTDSSIQPLEPRRLLAYVPFGGDQNPGFDGFVSGTDIAASPGGDSILVARVINTDANKEEVIAIRYGTDGSQLGNRITVASWAHPTAEGALPQGDPTLSVSMDDNNNAAVAYISPSGATIADALYVSRISATGVVAAPILIAQPSNTSESLSKPAISMDSAGGFYVGYRSFYVPDYDEAPADSEGAVVERYDATDHKLGAATVEHAYFDNGSPHAIDVAAFRDGSGAVYAVSRDYSQGGPGNNQTDTIEYGRLDATGTQLDQTNRILNDVQWSDSFLDVGNDQNIDDADEPSVATNADHTFEIGYRRFVTDETRNDVSIQAAYVQRFHGDGSKHGAPIELADGLPGVGIRTGTHGVNVAALPDGGFLATFEQTIGSADTIYVRQYDPTGVSDPAGPIQATVRGAEDLDDSGLQTAQIPQLATDGAGNATAAFANAIYSFDDAHIVRLSDRAGGITDGVLYVPSTSGDDTIEISIDHEGILVTVNNQPPARFDPSEVQAIQIDGGAGNDTITNNTAIPSTLGGGDGNDTIFGGSAADRLDGGPGDDSLWGNDGADRIAGDDGHDYLYGGGSNDKIYGGLQPDLIRGNAGRDKLYGNGGSDRIYGGASADSIYGQGGNDQLFGEGGNDRLYADYELGSSTLHGGSGNDTLVSANDLADQLFGDGGHDSASADPLDQLISIEEVA